MASVPSDAAIQAAARDGNLRLLKGMATGLDLRGLKCPNGRTLLHIAAAEGRLDVCKFLVEASGLHVNSTSAEGETPVLLAAEAEGKGNGTRGILRYLLDHSGDPALPDARGSTPLHNAAEYGNCKAVKLLLNKGVPVDPLSHRGTPLHLAAGYGHGQAVKILLEHGADPNSIANHVNSPLMAACYAQSLECMKLLVEAGADVNFRSPSGPPVLFLAVDDGLTNIVKFLLEVGADPNIRDEELVEKKIADAKSQGKEAFAKGDYLAAICFYDLAMRKDPLDATLFSNRSLCWLRLREGEPALSDAQHCKTLSPQWAKAWYREGAALSLLKNYKGAADALEGALKLDPANNEIKKALREARESLKSAATAARSGEQNPQPASV
ncbi:unnamed protein product [Urochloa humidicola]